MAAFVFDVRDGKKAAPNVPENQQERPELGFPTVGFHHSCHSQLHPMEFVAPSNHMFMVG